jgi:hypothetical protein
LPVRAACLVPPVKIQPLGVQIHAACREGCSGDRLCIALDRLSRGSADQQSDAD